jgi:hypothetical protein
MDKKKDDFELRLEANSKTLVDLQPLAPLGAIMTPPLDEDFWLLRVPVSDKQAIVAFPKVGTIGVGFQHEEDWNTNLPSACGASRIWHHIKHNKGDSGIPDARCKAALELLLDAVAKLIFK